MTAAWRTVAHAGIKEAQEALLRPSAEALDGMLPALEQAAASLTMLRSEVQSSEAEPGLGPALAALAGEVGRSRALLDTAAGWHSGWARLLYSAVCGYTAQGEPAPPPLTRSLSLEG